MFRSLFKREIRKGITSVPFVITLTAMCLLVVVTGYAQARHYKQALAELASRIKMSQSASGTKQDIVVLKPAPLLSPFFNGVYNNVADEFSFRSQSVFVSPSNEDIRPLNWISPDIDLGQLINVFLTLIALFLSYDAVLVEKDNASQDILSNPMIRRSVLTGKVAGTMALTGILLLTSVALYVATVCLASGGSYKLTGSTVSALAVCALAGFITICIFVLIGFTISAVAHSATASLYAAVTVWIIAVVIWPPSAVHLATRIYSPPAPQTFRRELLRKEAELDLAELAEHKQAAAELIASGMTIQDAQKRYFEIHRKWLEKKEEELGPLVDGHRHLIRAQQSLCRYLQSFSPYGAFEEFVVSICRTGPEDHESFIESAELYGRQVFMEDQGDNDPPGQPVKPNPSAAALTDFQIGADGVARRALGAAPLFAFLLLQIGLLTCVSIYRFKAR
jgi:ABC-type transport system involved in multi-copper enzyme maturation permease subunit